MTSAPPTDRAPVVTAGVVLGIGLGGFVDGIVFHQILQLHGMVSALHPPNNLVNLEYGMVWDGVFHAFTWITTVCGVVLLVRTASRLEEPWAHRVLVGSSLLGWGIFNLVEGTIDHLILEVHHVVERLGLSVWDGVFLASGAVLAAAGVSVIRSADPAPAVRRPSSNV